MVVVVGGIEKEDEEGRRRDRGEEEGTMTLQLLIWLTSHIATNLIPAYNFSHKLRKSS